jgi:Fic family protein
MSISEFEPLMPREGDQPLEELAVTLIARANQLGGQLHPKVRMGIGDLVRSMNCYYSNLIEGHNTNPRDIDRAMADDYSRDPRRRVLQKEARAHIEVQRMIDVGEDPKDNPMSLRYLKWLHYEFCKRLPEELLVVRHPRTACEVIVVPGEFRDGAVEVGRHLPPEAADIPRFIERMEEAYNPVRLLPTRRLIAVAAAHHRLLWVHPFYDGNGRVARLAAHAMLLRFGVGSSIWSIARGLARKVEGYKTALMLADETRQGDLDGRGALSEKRLHEFCEFFLATCIDQVDFMESLLQPADLLRRMKLQVDDDISAQRLPRGSLALLREALLAGELDRGRAGELTGYQERRGREILAELLKAKLLVPQGPRAPVRLGFPTEIAERWFPRLYPVD